VGLDIRTAEFLLHAKKLGTNFSNVATLGHQRVFLSFNERRRISAWLGGNVDCNHEYADFYLRALGAEHCSSIDASRYEGAEIIHNLNADLPSELHQRFTCLIDGGTLEHVFDIRKSLKSCMQMVEVGGHLVICQMANNCMGHGFYQFSPEFFYCTLTPENGYRVKFMALNEDGHWFEPLAPQQAKERIQARTKRETFIFVLAERISDVEPFTVAPHQSDYVSNLDVIAGANAVAAAAEASRLKALRKKLGDIKRRHVYRAFPWLSALEERYSRYKYLRHDRLSNSRRFRDIGKRLTLSALGLVASSLHALLESVPSFEILVDR
jgi:hypothetical protein